MSGCVQFSQMHLVKVIKVVRTLEIADFTSTQLVSHSTLDDMLCIGLSLQMISIDPDYFVKDHKLWENIVVKYRNIHFGCNLMRLFPYNGQYLRIEHDDSSD